MTIRALKLVCSEATDDDCVKVFESVPWDIVPLASLPLHVLFGDIGGGAPLLNDNPTSELSETEADACHAGHESLGDFVTVLTTAAAKGPGV